MLEQTQPLTLDTPIPAGWALNPDQQEAIGGIQKWLETPDSPYFLLSGAAGTGKTFCVQALIAEFDGCIVFTAPTNKATKVLRQTLTTEDYTPICRTIYSLLGLKLEPSGAVKQLTSPEDPVDLAKIKLIVLDETSMVNQVLMRELDKAISSFKVKILFLGDSNQLPPVGEPRSLVWELDIPKAELHQVMRFDNQILELAERIKPQVNHPAPTVKLYGDNDGIEGVWMSPPAEFQMGIVKAARDGDFNDPERMVKAIAWRNVTVAHLNSIIRSQIFDNYREQQWLPGDRIILTAPAFDMDNKQLGCTDDEGTIERVEIAQHPMYSDFKCFNTSVITDENKRISLWLLHKDSEFEFRFRQNQMATEAKHMPRKWKDFWTFSDSFHKAQHGYAITAHRAQGSTYDTCYVVWTDILKNWNRQEAFRCLYVACTRAKNKLILGGM